MNHTMEILTTIGTVLYGITTAARAIPTKEHDEIQGGFMKLISLLFCHNNTK